jgi:hypothetical protein
MSENDNDLPDIELSSYERVKVREMLRDFDRAKYMRKQVRWFAIWILGLPTALATLIASLSQIIAWIRGH